MKRCKLLLRLPNQLMNSVSPTQHSGLHCHTLPQVTRSSRFTQINPNLFSAKPYIYTKNPFNFHQNKLFSSNPESFIDVVLSNDEWSEKLENELETLNPKLAHESVLCVLVKSFKNPQKSLDFFKWVCEKKEFNPSFTPYFVLLRTLARKEFMSEFWNVLNEMKSKGVYIDDRAYSTINTQLSHKLRDKSAEFTKVYTKMVEMDPEKEIANTILESIRSFDWGEDVKAMLMKKLVFPLKENFVLRILAELYHQPLNALPFFKWIGSCGLYKHDSVTYNAIAQILAHPDSVSEFWDFVHRMRMEGYEVDLYTYMRSSTCLPEKDSVELYEFMMDGPYKPSLELTKSLIKLLSKILRDSESNPDLIYRVFNKFLNAGNLPTKTLYDSIHRALCTLGRFDEAKKTVNDMRDSGFKLNSVTYDHEICGLCKKGKLDEACKVTDQMEVDGFVPSPVPWTKLIQGLFLANRLDLALSYLEKTEKKNVRVSKDTFILMIKKLVEGGNFGKAVDILSMMKKYYRVIYNPVIWGIAKRGTVGDARRLVMVLSPKRGAGVARVYRKVVRAFFKQRRYLDAKDLVLSVRVMSGRIRRSVRYWGLIKFRIPMEERARLALEYTIISTLACLSKST